MIALKRFITLLFAILYTACLLSCSLAVTYRDAPTTDVPDYKQDDPRWADTMYSSHGDKGQTIKYHGCALCVVADLAAYWFDPSITPADIIPLARKAEAIAYQGGTFRTLYDSLGEFYPLTVEQTADLSRVIDCLTSDGLVIVSFAGGVWNSDRTKRHSCLIYAYQYGEFWLHDPGWSDPLLSQIIGHGSYDTIQTSAESFWCCWREGR